MFKFFKRLLDIILDSVVWVIVYPDKNKSVRLSWSIAKYYVEVSGGEIKHCEDLE